MEIRRHLRATDAWAVALVGAAILVGALHDPVRHALDPLEAMRAAWRDDPALLERLRDWNGEPMWADGRGGALPSGYPGNLGGKDLSQNEKWLRERRGRRFVDGRGWVEAVPAPDERFPALASVPPDRWGSPYVLTVSWRRAVWGVVSAGPDRQSGTADDLSIFAWKLDSYEMYYPMRVDALLYLLAGLWAWAYAVWRAWDLPRLGLVGEVARAVVVVTPFFALCSMVTGALRIPSLTEWNELQLVPAWLALSFTLAGCAAGGVLWRRLRTGVNARSP